MSDVVRTDLLRAYEESLARKSTHFYVSDEGRVRGPLETEALVARPEDWTEILCPPDGQVRASQYVRRLRRRAQAESKGK